MGTRKTGFESHETRDCVAETRVRPTQKLEKNESGLVVRKQKADGYKERLAFSLCAFQGHNRQSPGVR
jgi:hypothetical protein